MVELLKDLPASVLISFTAGLLGVLYAILKVAAWFFGQWWEDRKRAKSEQTTALMANTLAIVELKVQIQSMNEALRLIPKIKQDVDLAHSMIREIKKNV